MADDAQPGDKFMGKLWEQLTLPTEPIQSFPGTNEMWAAEMLEQYAGLNVNSEHGRDTPQRFLSMLDELTKCKPSYNAGEDMAHIADCIKWKVFPAENDEMVVVRDIPFVSVCNHHVLPFEGVAHIAYVPDQHIAGLSKFGRVVQHFARQLQVQERLTADVTDWLMEALEPQGVGVVMDAEHMCMTIRGLQAPGTTTITSAMRGVFAEHDRTAKAEFLHFIGRPAGH